MLVTVLGKGWVMGTVIAIITIKSDEAVKRFTQGVSLSLFARAATGVPGDQEHRWTNSRWRCDF
jgi:hypothetical protein